MPLGFERLNERVKRPNELINFIRPLSGKDEAQSKDFLERVAAVVYPVMKENTISVMALEEFPPNREFLGRNFNAGEVIQLVLKSSDGHWLPFRHVQMVMIHELAHCKQMNHSKFFWDVRNSYASELRELWAKSYTGEGLWGKGRGLKTGAHLTNHMPDNSLIPESLCGGVYRRRGKRKLAATDLDKEALKAKRKEQKEKRILRKFGVGGVSLGADAVEREKLEEGKKTKGKGKPRVAGSARARELRAAAALARFERVKEEPKEPDTSETESEEEWTKAEIKLEEEDRTKLDPEGDFLVRICKDEDGQDEHVKQEKRELLTDYFKHTPKQSSSKSEPGDPSAEAYMERHNCPVCSCENDDESVLCIACMHVLNTALMPNHWHCQSEACIDGQYLNAGDVGRCMVCGASKP